MKFLLDTCAFLWIVSDDPKLTDNARTIFHNPDNEIFLSVVPVWEIIVKHALGKSPLPADPRSFVYALRETH